MNIFYKNIKIRLLIVCTIILKRQQRKYTRNFDKNKAITYKKCCEFRYPYRDEVSIKIEDIKITVPLFQPSHVYFFV